MTLIIPKILFFKKLNALDALKLERRKIERTNNYDVSSFPRLMED